MARLERIHKAKYNRTSSPLYGTRSKRRLAEVLGWEGGPKDLDRFARQPDNYNCFDIKEEGKKPRPVQEPKPRLSVLHRQIAKLLLRIEPPAYLHSGLRKRSFVTNAAAHVNGDPAVKLDVHKFYPSTLHSHVCGFFKNQMRCAPDVAGLLATLSCVVRDGISHLPTGSPLSQILAFYSHERMFSELHAYVVDRNGVFTVYVDDVTASMQSASPADIQAMGRIITKHGLLWHKQRFFRRGCPKAVTGVIAKASHLEAPKRQHLKYALARDMAASATLPAVERRRAARVAVGVLQCIAQIDERQLRTAKGMAQRLTTIADLT